MTEFVVFGMHRSGTSLVAHLMSVLGVDMGGSESRPLMQADAWNPTGYWEDAKFVNLADMMLEMAGGDWTEPPPAAHIAQVAQALDQVIASLIAQQAGTWGWKDPRNCLVAHAYLPHLRDPHFVMVSRNPKDVADSLLRRSRGWAEETRAAILAGEYVPGWKERCSLACRTKDDWVKLTREYERRARGLNEVLQAPWCNIRYEQLTKQASARRQVEKLAEFCGGGDVEAAMEVIEWR